MSATQRYRVRHETVYQYGGNVAHAHHLLHLSPRDSPRQSCHFRALELRPAPSSRSESVDAFGNLASRIEYNLPHDSLEVLAEVGVEVRMPAEPAAQPSHPWTRVRDALTYSAKPTDPEYLDASRYRMESSYVRVKHAFSDYAADCFADNIPTALAAEALMHKIHREFVYAPGATTAHTSATEAFEARRGVCQDFAHIMIACLRARGLAARYVSGYLRTSPPPDAAPGFVGADASHAWVSVFCPPLGWIDFDPTNAVRVGTGHIIIAWGRDFADVSPLRGVIVGGGDHRLTVRVSVRAE